MIWTHNLSPYIFQLPNGFGLRWYGLAYVIGFVFAFFALKRAVEVGGIPGLTQQKLESLLFWIILGVVGGGRLGYVLQYPEKLLADPLLFFRFNEGGMAFFGGLGGVVLALIFFGRKSSISFNELADQLTIPAALSLALGRIANFMNGELWGKPTDGTWGVIFPQADSLPRHPSQIYDMVSHFLLALLLWGISKTSWGKKPSSLWITFVLGYGAFRFVTEAFRDETRPVGPLVAGQVASLVIIAIGLVGYFFLNSRRPVRNTHEPGA
jgi:phosphatidylglycerol:prolipoprotein diacylglycerol transferase